MKTNPNPFNRRQSSPGATFAAAAATGLVIAFAPLIHAAPETDAGKKNDPAEVESKQFHAKQEEAAKAPAANGKVFSVEPELLSVVVEGSATPLKFKYDRDTPYVDENGKEVSMELIRPDLPLTVHYTGTGEILTASKVVVTRSMIDGASPKAEAKREQIAEKAAKEAEKEKVAMATEPETVMGTVSTVEQTITVTPRGESTPRSFVINNSTRYLNPSGQPVSTDLIFSGMPITVKAVSDGHRLIAQVITVRGNAGTAESGYPANGGSAGGASGSASGTSTAAEGSSTGSAGPRSNGSARTIRSSGGGGADLPFYGVTNPGIVGPLSTPGNVSSDAVPDANGSSTSSAQARNMANANGGQNGSGTLNRNNLTGNNNNNSNTQANSNGSPSAANQPGSNQPGNIQPGNNQPTPDNQPNPDNRPSNNQPANNQPANNQPSGTNAPAPANGSSSTSGNGANRSASGSQNSGTGGNRSSGSSSSSTSGSTRSNSGRSTGNGSSGAPAPSAGGGGSGGSPAPSR